MTPSATVPDDETMEAAKEPAELPPGAGQASGARALVSLDGDEPERARIVRPLTGFLAQLLACRDGAPQTRARRRAGAGAAVRSYRVPTAGCGARALSKRI